MTSRQKTAGSRHSPPRDLKRSGPAGDRSRIKNPDEWVTGEEPMTDAQASYLKTLSVQTREPDAFDPMLDKADASKRIDELKRERDGG